MCHLSRYVPDHVHVNQRKYRFNESSYKIKNFKSLLKIFRKYFLFFRYTTFIIFEYSFLKESEKCNTVSYKTILSVFTSASRKYSGNNYKSHRLTSSKHSVKKFAWYRIEKLFLWSISFLNHDNKWFWYLHLPYISKSCFFYFLSYLCLTYDQIKKK